MARTKKYQPTEFMLPTSHYDKERADHAVNFIQSLKHTKGVWAGQPFLLFDWQEKIIRDLFGTIKANGYRQFNTAFVEICKKAGKSELAAAVALYMLAGDGEEGAEIYGCANDRQQAKHDHFFEVLALLNDDEKSLYCETTPMGSPEGLEGVAKARWWAEWQANSLAPRYLMPRWIFNKIFAAQLAKYQDDDYLSRGQVMECAIGDTARYFQVSVYEVKLRALQLGYKQAEGTYLRVKGHDQPAFSFNPDALGNYQTFILDGRNGSRLYEKDPKFAKLIDSGRYVYINAIMYMMINALPCWLSQF